MTRKSRSKIQEEFKPRLEIERRTWKEKFIDEDEKERKKVRKK